MHAILSRCTGLLLATVALSGSELVAQVSGRGAVRAPEWSGVTLGPFPVGYRAVDVRDSTRTLLPDTLAPRPPRLRTIPLRLWYPAEPPRTGATRLTFAELVAAGTSAAESPAARDAEPAGGLARRTYSIHAYAAQKYARAGGTPLIAGDTAGVTRLALATRTAAVGGLPPASGRHPLVLFAGGTAHSVDENVALWEHLASNGYIVAAVPTVAAEEGADDAFLPDDALGLETVTRDLETVLASLYGRPDVDTLRIAAAGFSFGGAAALALAARDARVRAVVGLDPSFIARRHLPMLQNAPLLDARRLAVPVLELHRADTATVDLALLERARRSRRVSIELAGLDHVDFNSYVLLYGPLLRQRAARARRDAAIATKAAAYRAMVETTRAFLGAALGTAPLIASEAQRSPAPLANLPPILRGEGPAWSAVPRAAIRVREWLPSAANGSP